MTAGRLIFAFAVATALAAGAFAGWRYAPTTGALFASRATPKPAPRPPDADPLKTLQPDLAALLLRPARDAPSPFVHLPWVKPEPFCKSLEKIGFTGVAFHQGEAPMRGWTCLTDLLKPVGGEEGAVSSLFFSARGFEDDRVDALRLKLNLLDPATVPVVKAIAKDLLRSLFRGIGWEPPVAVFDAVDALKERRIEERGVVYDLRKEFGDQLRLNLIVTFPERLGAGGEGRFIEGRK